MTGWKDSLQRRDEVKAAFLEGFMLQNEDAGFEASIDTARKQAEKAWTASTARRNLEEPLEEKP